MHSSDNGLVVVCVIIEFLLVHCESVNVRGHLSIANENRSIEEIESEKDDDLPEDLYSFVALIDIVFTDGFKKTCTGTIIHDNVVITAAHCVKMEEDNYIQAELTASFVVIGTKKMFETGYEQYLPIERVIIHPKYSGWTADLALIHTFAGMMSDKPGRIVPLATEKTNTPVFSDITVFSWGQYKFNNVALKFTTKKEMEIDDEIDDNLGGQTWNNGNEKVTSFIPLDSVTEDDIHVSQTTLSTTQLIRNKRRKKLKRKKRIRPKAVEEENEENFYRKESSIEARSKYRQYTVRNSNSNLRDFDSKDQLSVKKKKKNLEKYNVQVSTTLSNRYSKKSFGGMSYYRNNWRRKMGDQQNKLSVEVFGFVNMQTCMKLIEKAMPSPYEIHNTNEVLCYANEEHVLTEEDSGAPAMRRGHLVAVTVGGVIFEGESVALGMKIACFCSWISENIPKTGTSLKCCKNCCEKTNDTENDKAYLRHQKPKK